MDNNDERFYLLFIAALIVTLLTVFLLLTVEINDNRKLRLELQQTTRNCDEIK